MFLLTFVKDIIVDDVYRLSWEDQAYKEEHCLEEREHHSTYEEVLALLSFKYREK